MKLVGIVFFAVSFLISAPPPAASQVAGELKPNQIQIQYVPPTNPEHGEVAQLLKERRVLEKFQEFLSPIRLPRPLTLKVQGCDGDNNAWYDYDEYTVTVCYELIKGNKDHAPKETTPAGVTPEDGAGRPCDRRFFSTKQVTSKIVICSVSPYLDTRKTPRINLRLISCCNLTKRMRDG